MLRANMTQDNRAENKEAIHGISYDFTFPSSSSFFLKKKEGRVIVIMYVSFYSADPILHIY